MHNWGLINGLTGLFILAMAGAFVILRPLRRALWIVLPLVSGLVVWGYLLWGSKNAVDAFALEQEKRLQVNAMLKTIKSPQQLIDKLQQQLHDNPESARGWFLLGRLHASLHEWQQAKECYSKALALKPDDEEITVNYIHTLWEINHRLFNADIHERLLRLLQKNPQQPDALAMLAMEAMQKNQPDQAVAYWEQLLKQVPKDSKEASAIRQAIAKARAGAAEH